MTKNYLFDEDPFPKRKKPIPIDPKLAAEIEEKSLNALRKDTILGFSCSFCYGGRIIGGKCEECSKNYKL
ncbi:MAG: hypothetical protein ACYTXI_35125 [Nostoc sp.]|jgi:hypothetical protein